MRGPDERSDFLFSYLLLIRLFQLTTIWCGHVSAKSRAPRMRR